MFKKKNIFLLMTLFFTGCDGYKKNSPSSIKQKDLDKIVPSSIKQKDLDKIVFIRLQNSVSGDFQFQALLRGTLFIHNSCIQILAKYSNTIYTPIWPTHYSLHSRNNKIIINDNSRVIGIDGQEISISGGELQNADHLNINSPKQCTKNKYWLVGVGLTFK